MLGGRYRVGEQLGSLGALQLTAAVELASGRTVTLERLPLSAAAPDAARRFDERLRRALALRHPGLLETRAGFEAEGALWVVSEPVSAESLRARLARASVPLSQLLSWLASALRGVAALHQHGLVHGGLCPELIYVASDPGARARVHPCLLAALCPPDPRSAYHAPQELELDVRSDVYAFGAIAYEALTGRPPDGTTPLSRRRPELPSELCTLIDLALAGRREDRLSSLDAMLTLLEPCVQALRRRGGGEEEIRSVRRGADGGEPRCRDCRTTTRVTSSPG